MSKKTSKANVKTAAKKPQAKKEAPKAAANNINWGESVKIAVILFAICAVITALLAATNMLTEEKIAENALLEKQEACKAVIAAEEYIELDCGYDVYLAISGGEVVGCTVTTAKNGYGGEVTVMVGFDMDGDITGVDIIEHGETPGLGANADKPSFLDQFKSEDKTGHSDDYAVEKDGGEVDALTAATVSSRAVTEAVDAACDIYDELYSEGKLVVPQTNEGGEE